MACAVHNSRQRDEHDPDSDRVDEATKQNIRAEVIQPEQSKLTPRADSSFACRPATAAVCSDLMRSHGDKSIDGRCCVFVRPVCLLFPRKLRVFSAFFISLFYCDCRSVSFRIVRPTPLVLHGGRRTALTTVMRRLMCFDATPS